MVKLPAIRRCVKRNKESGLIGLNTLFEWVALGIYSNGAHGRCVEAVALELIDDLDPDLSRIWALMD